MEMNWGSILQEGQIGGQKIDDSLTLSDGDDVNARDYGKRTLLHRACYYHKEKVIRLLIRKGADVNAKDYYGKTPFSKLQAHRRDYDKCVYAMVEGLAKHDSVSEQDLSLLEEIPKAKEYFEKCVEELDRMSSVKFHGHYSYRLVLKKAKNITKLAYLAENHEFSVSFKESLSEFYVYKDALEKTWEEAVQLKNSLGVVTTRLKEIFSDFLPDIVIRKLSENLTVEDLPLE